MTNETRDREPVDISKRSKQKRNSTSTDKKSSLGRGLARILTEGSPELRKILDLEAEIKTLKQQIDELSAHGNFQTQFGPEVGKFKNIPLVCCVESARNIANGSVREVCKLSGIPCELGVLMPDHLDLDDLFTLHTDDAIYGDIPQHSNVIISKSQSPRDGDYVLCDLAGHLHLYVYEEGPNETPVVFDEMLDIRRPASSVLGVVIGLIDIKLKFTPRIIK